MRVAIAGAGAVGRSIARELLGKQHEVLLIDKEPAKVERRPGPGAEWLLGDACEVANLEAAKLEECDVVVGRHRRRQGQPRRVAARQDRVRGTPGRGPDQPSRQRVAVHRGVGRRRRGVHAAGARRAGRGGRRGRRHRPAVRHPRGPGQPASSSRLPEDAPCSGHPVRDLQLPKDTTLVGIVRGRRVITPDPGGTARGRRRAAVRRPPGGRGAAAPRRAAALSPARRDVSRRRGAAPGVTTRKLNATAAMNSG